MSENHNKSIFLEVQDRYNTSESLGIRLHRVGNSFSARQKTRNLCCFLIAYSGFPKLKAYGKIGQNRREVFMVKKGLKKFFEECLITLLLVKPYHQPQKATVERF